MTLTEAAKAANFTLTSLLMLSDLSKEAKAQIAKAQRNLEYALETPASEVHIETQSKVRII